MSRRGPFFAVLGSRRDPLTHRSSCLSLPPDLPGVGRSIVVQHITRAHPPKGLVAVGKRREFALVNGDISTLRGVADPRRSRDLKADAASTLAVSDLVGDPLGSGALEGSPAKDVASLVQSLDHVGRIVERRRRVSVATWIREASHVCLEAYRGELAALGASTLFDERLVRPFRVAQELHEFVYAARYLPSRLYVPDRALAAILEASRALAAILEAAP
jgi:hypothetical protein